MKNYKAILINGNRMIIFTLLGCALIMVFFTVRFYMKQQKKVMKGQAKVRHFVGVFGHSSF